MLQSSCKLINNLIQSPPPPASVFMPQQCAELLLFFTHLLCKVCKFLGFAIQMWPSHRTHLFHRDINSSGYSQLKPAGNKAGCIRLCFRNTEANQIVHPRPLLAELLQPVRNLIILQCRLKKKAWWSTRSAQKDTLRSCCFFFTWLFLVCQTLQNVMNKLRHDSIISDVYC